MDDVIQGARPWHPIHVPHHFHFEEDDAEDHSHEHKHIIEGDEAFMTTLRHIEVF